MSDIMSSVIGIVNVIRGGNKAQRHRKFVQFLNDMNAKYEDVPLYSKNLMVECRKHVTAFLCFAQRNLIFSAGRSGRNGKV